MADIPEHNLVYTYEWNQFTNVYNKFGYYMLFNKGRMIVMLSQKDMPDDIKAAVPAYIKSHVDRNICKINLQKLCVMSGHAITLMLMLLHQDIWLLIIRHS